MANYKRRKPRRYVRCGICTDHRHGNCAETHGKRYHVRKKEDEKEMRESNEE